MTNINGPLKFVKTECHCAAIIIKTFTDSQCSFIFINLFRKYLIPDSNDEIRQEQMREMELIAVGTGDSITAAGMAGIASPSGENLF